MSINFSVEKFMKRSRAAPKIRKTQFGPKRGFAGFGIQRINFSIEKFLKRSGAALK
jgi:hypothetical protein